MPMPPSDQACAPIHAAVSKPSFGIVDDRTPVAFRLVAPAHILHDDHISARHEVLGDLGRCAILPVRRPLQQHRKFAFDRRAVAGRPVNIRGQLDSVAHGNHDVLHYRNFVSLFALRTKRRHPRARK